MLLTYVFGALLILLLASILLVLCIIINRLGSINTRFLASAQLYDTERNVTTNMPIPLAAATCLHHWDILKDDKLIVPHEQRSILVMQCTNCGLVDKTVQITSKPELPKLPTPKSECRHKWEKEQKVVLESAYEQMLKSISEKANNGSRSTKVKADKELDLDLSQAPQWMFRKTYMCWDI